MEKRFLSILLAAVMVLSLLPAPALADDGDDLTSAGLTEASVEQVAALAADLRSAEASFGRRTGRFIWDTEGKNRSWTYYNGIMMDAYLMLDYDEYFSNVNDFYNENVSSQGRVDTAGSSDNYYRENELDSIPPVRALFDLLRSGNISASQRRKYEELIWYVYDLMTWFETVPGTDGNFIHKMNNSNWSTYQVALDGLYMAQPFFMELAKAIEDGIFTIGEFTEPPSTYDLYSDVVSRMVWIGNNLYDESTGLYNHGWGPSAGVNGQFWLRAVGWYAAALADVISMLPEDFFAEREELIAIETRLFDGMLAYQDEETGMWYNVINYGPELSGSASDNKLESSGSTLLAYAMLKSYSEGYVGRTYGKAGLRAFNGTVTNELYDGGLHDVYISSDVGTTPESYLTKTYTINEAKGVGPLMMAACYANAAAELYNQVYSVSTAALPENGGSVTAEPASAAEDQIVTLSAVPATGYDFDGWTVLDEYGDVVEVTDDQFVMPGSNVTVTAAFTAQSFLITFQNEDGTVLQSGLVDYGETPLFTGDTPVKVGPLIYTFDGWDAEIVPVDGPATYTATFRPSYTVSFYPGTAGEEAVPGEPFVITSADEDVWSDVAEDGKFFYSEDAEKAFFCYPECPFSAPEGYVFTGWSLPGFDPVLPPGGSWVAGGSDVLTALWAREYTITTAPMADDFAAWIRVPETAGEGDRFITTFTITADAYEAGWRPEKILFTDEDGNVTEVYAASDGSTFIDWNPTNLSGRMMYAFPLIMPGSDITISVVFRGIGPIVITQQPADAAAPLGEVVSTTVVAEGEGLKYQWYGIEPDGRTFTSSLKGDTYSVKMVSSKIGRKVYCVITDQDGNTITTRTATLGVEYPADYAAPVITTDAADCFVDVGETASVTIEATGCGELKYQWYLLNKGEEKWCKSSLTGDTYACAMNGTRDGRQIYCVVTDAYGNTAQTSTVTIGFDYPDDYVAPTVSISEENCSPDVDAGERASVTVTAQGADLTYQWYLMNPGTEKWSRSSLTGDTYFVTMVPAKSGRQVKCVVTDKYGNKAETEAVTLTMVIPEDYTGLSITAQPADVTVPKGELASTTVAAEGAGLTYQWYGREANGREFKSGLTGDTYSVAMIPSKSGRQVWCVITDKYGNSVTSEVATLTMG